VANPSELENDTQTKMKRTRCEVSTRDLAGVGQPTTPVEVKDGMSEECDRGSLSEEMHALNEAGDKIQASLKTACEKKWNFFVLKRAPPGFYL
jgi:hypothetical protein